MSNCICVYPEECRNCSERNEINRLQEQLAAALDKLKRIENIIREGVDNMPHPHKNRPRKGRRKIGSKKRKAQSNNRKK